MLSHDNDINEALRSLMCFRAGQLLEQYVEFDLLFVLQLEYLRYTDPNPKPFVPSLTLTNKCLINYLKVKKVGGEFFNILRKISKSNRKPSAKTKIRLAVAKNYFILLIYEI